MTDALITLQAAFVAALEAHPVLAAELSGVYDGPPPRAVFPYVAIGDALVSDWSTKTATGREIRLPLILWDEGENAEQMADLMAHLEDAIAALPRQMPGWHLANITFLRSMVVRDAAGPWAGLVEHRLRLLAT
ncbi:DUF3168 domain-containing protein [Sphingorhabdus sp. IMCC26285]|uniref:DUF3168 domain-containing protein n=1 Tax=Sphingorhabdus profundilacus TaxID=2509718 RepID=A0A6I4M6M6_9SPHN|nr:DUF3168 domain-containing protein [Sphingorhabdus profundilacus]MVZ97785.1 DUF3168 domain-containing protein [Sphingorhabdus profundilacus]